MVASFGGSDKAPDWYLNLVANPEVTVERRWARGGYRAVVTACSVSSAGIQPMAVRTMSREYYLRPVASPSHEARSWSPEVESMKGSCLCGAVQYEADQLDGPIGHCHCHTCRKANAAAFNSFGSVNREHFRWLKGQDKLSSFESSRGKLRYFCSVCGSQLIADRQAQPYVILRVATLDDDPGVRPAAHIWTSHDVPWLGYGAEIPAFAELPPARE